MEDLTKMFEYRFSVPFWSSGPQNVSNKPNKVIFVYIYSKKRNNKLKKYPKKHNYMQHNKVTPILFDSSVQYIIHTP